jgi:DNA polymerase-3 subunit beta
MLTAVNIEFTGRTMTLAATDRYRLAVRELAWSPSPGTADTAVLVPARTLADAGRMMIQDEPVRIMLRASDTPDGADAMVGFEAAGRRLTTRLLAGEFIRYRSRFPDEFGSTADLPAEAFTEAVRRVALVAERGTPGQGDGARRVQRRRAGDRVQRRLPARRGGRGDGRRRGRAGQAALHQREQARGDHAVAARRPGRRLQVPGRAAARAAVAGG